MEDEPRGGVGRCQRAAAVWAAPAPPGDECLLTILYPQLFPATVVVSPACPVKGYLLGQVRLGISSAMSGSALSPAPSSSSAGAPLSSGKGLPQIETHEQWLRQVRAQEL